MQINFLRKLEISQSENGQLEKEMEGFKFDGEDIIIHLDSSFHLDFF